MAERRILKDNGIDILPITHESAVLTDEGVTLDEKYIKIKDIDTELQGYYDKIDDIKDAVDKLGDNLSMLESRVGSLEDLDTINKNSLADAFNELFHYGNETKQKLVDILIANGHNVSTKTTFTEIFDILKKCCYLKRYFAPSAFIRGISSSAPCPYAFHGACATTHKDLIYIAGGTTKAWNNTSATTNLFLSFNPKTYEYKVRANLPQSLIHARMCSLGDSVLLVGGTNSGSAVQDTVYMYNPTTNTWTTKGSLLYKLYAGCLESVNGKAYYMCGATGGFNTNTKVKYNMCYDPSTNTWTSKVDFNTTAVFCSSSCVDDNSNIHVMGGFNYNTSYNGDISTTAHRVYNPTTNTWSSGISLASTNSLHCSVCINNVIFMFPGFYRSYSSSSGWTENYRSGIYRLDLNDSTQTSWVYDRIYHTFGFLRSYALASYGNKVFTFMGLEDTTLTDKSFMFVPNWR